MHAEARNVPDSQFINPSGAGSVKTNPTRAKSVVCEIEEIKKVK